MIYLLITADVVTSIDNNSSSEEGNSEYVDSRVIDRIN